MVISVDKSVPETEKVCEVEAVPLQVEKAVNVAVTLIIGLEPEI